MGILFDTNDESSSTERTADQAYKQYLGTTAK